MIHFYMTPSGAAMPCHADAMDDCLAVIGIKFKSLQTGTEIPIKLKKLRPRADLEYWFDSPSKGGGSGG